MESKAFDHGAYIEEGRAYEAELTARERISSFITRTPEDILTHPLTEEEQDLLQRSATFGREPSDTPNRRLAMAMLELEESVRVMYALRKGKVSSKRTIEDAETNKPTTYEFQASRSGSDFGMNLMCSFYAFGRLDGHGRPNDAVLYSLLPTKHYLYETLAFGDPHEPPFFASEPDVYSPEWSTVDREWLPNGGRTYRQISIDRGIFDAQRKYIADDTERRADIFRRDRVDYFPLYGQNAPGIERYMKINKALLQSFLEACDAGK